jgi:hypothetical protein
VAVHGAGPTQQARLVLPQPQEALASEGEVLSALVVYTGGGLVRELWRGFVRGAVLG